jgi:hypothetical protein
MSNLTIINWCQNDPCDPCSSPDEYNVSVIGNSTYGPPKTMFINWTWNAESGDPYPPDGTPLEAVVTITVTGYNATGMPQTASINMSGSMIFYGFPAILYLPLPLTPMGIAVVTGQTDPSRNPQLILTATGNVSPEAGGVGMVFS